MPILPANPKVINSRPYTGNSDGAAAGPIPGMDEWIRQAIKYSNGAIWNNGSWGVRDMKGKPGSLSVHSCGRAVDLSYRKSEKYPLANRKGAVAFLNTVLAHANELGIEQVLDYFPKPFGRGWRCDRQRWSAYTKPTIGSAPNGDWLHFEVSPMFVKQPANLIQQAFKRVFTELPQ
jgi:hypothetical protein